MSRTHIIMIVDASGSMSPYRADTVEGYNAYIRNLDKDVSDYTFTVALFSSHNYYQQLCLRAESAALLDDNNYRTRGNTALIDATMRAVSDFRQDFAVPDGDKVLVVTTTDGEENDSRSYTLDDVKKMITELQATGKWEFIFLSQGIDNWHNASKMGYARDAYVGTVAVDPIKSGETLSKFSTRYAGGAVAQSMRSVASEDFAEEELQA